MQAIVSANQKSETLKKMDKMGSYTPLYSIKKSWGPVGLQNHTIPPTINVPSGDISGKTVTFTEVAGSGFLMNSSYQFDCTCGALTAADVLGEPPMAFNLIRSVEYFSKGNLLFYKTGTSMLRQVYDMQDMNYQAFILQNAKMLSSVNYQDLAVATNTTFTCFIEDLQSYLTDAEKFLLTSALGEFQVRITFNTFEAAGLSSAVSTLVAKKYSQTYTPTPSKLNEMITADWSQPLSMPMIATFTETGSLKTPTTVENYNFVVPYLCCKSHISIVGVKNTAGQSRGSQLFPIYKVDSLNIGGTPYITNLPVSRVQSNSFRRGKSGFTYTNAGAITLNNGVLTIDWSVLCRTDQETGTAFFQQLRGSTISLTFATVTTEANAQLVIDHEYWQIVDYYPQGSGGTNGTLMVSENR